MMLVVKALWLALALLLFAPVASAQSWDDVPRDKKGRPWPERLPYRGGVVPNGYHVDTHTKPGLIIAGSVTFGVTYGLCVYLASQSRDDRVKLFYAPIVGPFIFAATVKNDLYGIGAAIGVVAGMVQTAGAAMLIVGLIPKTDLQRNDLASVRVVPLLAPNQSGLAVVGTF